MDFLIYSRAAASAADLDDDPELDERHWAYMDQFAHGMIARGPTLGSDRATWTGSIHILDLPDVEAVRQFIEREPYNRRGVYEQHLVRGFENLLGRTMWEFQAPSSARPFFVIAQRPAGARTDATAPLLSELWALADERLIVHGKLLTPEDSEPVGVALAVHASTGAAVEAFLTNRITGLHDQLDVEILDWEFGGRR